MELINTQNTVFVMNLLKELPDMMRKCIIFHILHELEYKEISKLLNISINTVKSHIRAEMKKLRYKFNEIMDQNFQNLL